MDVTFRPAVADDLASLCALDTTVRTDPARAPQIEAWIAARAAHIVSRDGSSAGYGALTHDFFHAGMIEMVMIAEPFRRRGLGVALVNHLAAFCRSGTLWSSTNSSNIAMQSLLDGARFIRSGLIEGLDEGDPEVIYRKQLR
ncbi:MAG: GNAT family N-acetyltransferase [Devosia sp.]